MASWRQEINSTLANNLLGWGWPRKIHKDIYVLKTSEGIKVGTKCFNSIMGLLRFFF